MINKILSTLLTLTVLSSVSTAAIAHIGHMANDSAHSFLHAEHIIMIAVISLTVCVIAILRNK
jgi:hypothetical protein